MYGLCDFLGTTPDSMSVLPKLSATRHDCMDLGVVSDDRKKSYDSLKFVCFVTIRDLRFCWLGMTLNGDHGRTVRGEVAICGVSVTCTCDVRASYLRCCG